MNKFALIDGDSFLYRAGFAVEKTKYLCQTFTDGLGTTLKDPEYVETSTSSEAKKICQALVGNVWTRKELGTLADAVAVLDGMIRKAIDAVGYKDYYLYLTPSTGNFRDALGTLRKYKGNRDTSSRPFYYPDLREHLLSVHQAIVARGEEADDQISWVARKFYKERREFVIIGIDKDLMQIPGRHYNWVDDEHKELSEDEARLFYWAQVLAGDSGDNIPGCYGLGLKKAEHFLVQCNGFSDDAMWPKIVRKFRDSQKLAGCPYRDLDGEQVALETARLVRLRQEMNEPLWEPPKTTKEGHGEKKE